MAPTISCCIYNNQISRDILVLVVHEKAHHWSASLSSVRFGSFVFDLWKVWCASIVFWILIFCCTFSGFGKSLNFVNNLILIYFSYKQIIGILSWQMINFEMNEGLQSIKDGSHLLHRFLQTDCCGICHQITMLSYYYTLYKS